MSRLEAVGLGVRRGGRDLLADVDLGVEAGRMLAVVGPNGAGKSTLLRCLSGELRPDVGQVTLDGRALSAWSPRGLAQRRAVLPQGSDLGFAFTVREIVGLGRLPHDDRPADALRLTHAAMERVGCVPLADRTWTTLSGGERQRVQLARVLAQLGEGRDGVLLLDEPTNHLDLPHQVHALAVARDLASQGVAVLAVLHDLGLAASFADTVVVLHAGRVVAVGPPASVLTPERVRQVFGLDVHHLEHPDGGPLLVPRIPRPTQEIPSCVP